MRLRLARWRMGMSIALAVKALRLYRLEYFAILLISSFDELEDVINESAKTGWHNHDVHE